MDAKPETDTNEPIVHGDADNGFIVEHHDGTTHRTHGSTAGSEEEAVAEAKRAWADQDKEADADADDGDYARAKRLNRGEVESMIAELRAEYDEKIVSLESRLDVHDGKFERMHEAMAEISKPMADAASAETKAD